MLGSAFEEHNYLYGHGSLKHFLNYMSTRPLDAAEQDMGLLTEDWRVAHSHLRRLRKAEASWADNAPIYTLPHSMQALLSSVESDPFRLTR